MHQPVRDDVLIHFIHCRRRLFHCKAEVLAYMYENIQYLYIFMNVYTFRQLFKLFQLLHCIYDSSISMKV